MWVFSSIGIAHAASLPVVIDFDPPGTPQGPSIYVAVPAQQTIVTAPATFSGGVVLGLATFFPAISFATSPNVYGTADFGNGLATSLTIDMDPTYITTEVSFALFNGETFFQSYSVDAFDGAILVGNQTLTRIAPNFNSGYGLVDLIVGTGITRINISPIGQPSVWDFLIDTVAFNQSLSVIPNPPPTPVIQPPTPPVQGHRHGHGKGETELVEVDFGDDVNDIRGSVLLVTPALPADTPEPATWILLATGLAFCLAARRKARA
jgi:hypothetical protein